MSASSRDGYQANESALHGAWLAMRNGGRGKVGQGDEGMARRAQEAWEQLRLVRYRIPAPETMTMSVEPSEGQDDFLMSIALMTEG